MSSTISLNIRVAFLYYESKTKKVTQSVAFFVLIFSIEFEQRLLILNRQQPEGTSHPSGAQRRAVGLIALQAGQGVVGSMSIPVPARAGEPKRKHRNRGAFLLLLSLGFDQ